MYILSYSVIAFLLISVIPVPIFPCSETVIVPPFASISHLCAGWLLESYRQSNSTGGSIDVSTVRLVSVVLSVLVGFTVFKVTRKK